MTTNNDENHHRVKGAKEVLKGCERQIKRNPRSTSLYYQRYHALMRLADAYTKIRKYKLAAETLDKAVAGCRKLAKLEPHDYDHPVNIGLIKEKQSHIKDDQGDLPGAAKLLRAAIRSHTKAIAIESEVASLYCMRGNVYQSLSYAERRRRKYALAERCAREGIKDYDKAVGLGYSTAYALRASAWALLALDKYSRGKDSEQAIALLQSGIKDYSRAVDDDVPKPRLLYLRAESKSVLAELKQKLQPKAGIKRLTRSAVEDYEAELQEDPFFYRSLIGIANVRYFHTLSEFARGDYAEALRAIKNGKEAARDVINLNSSCAPAYYERLHLTMWEAAIAERNQDKNLAETLVLESILDWQKLRELEPDDKHFKEGLSSAKKTLEQLYSRDDCVAQSAAKQAEQKVRS